MSNFTFSRRAALFGAAALPMIRVAQGQSKTEIRRDFEQQSG